MGRNTRETEEEGDEPNKHTHDSLVWISLWSDLKSKDVDGRDTSAFTRIHSPLKTGVNAL
jgi:hypothetical protein